MSFDNSSGLRLRNMWVIVTREMDSFKRGSPDASMRLNILAACCGSLAFDALRDAREAGYK